MEENTEGLIAIGKMVLTFSRVDRVTLHEDGFTPESDTDHTVMVTICSCSLASKLYPNLDIGKVAQFATVHDLVEVYAGDTNTFNITHEERQEKEKREGRAYERIQKEFAGVYPWIADIISEYESQESDESQFVKMVDKVMTKLTHRINHGAYLKKDGKTREETSLHYGNQTRAIEEKYGKKFPEVVKILKKLTSDILEETYVS